MKQTSKQEIVKQIERACREDLDKLAGAGIPREILLTQLALIAERGPERMTRKTKEQLRDNRDEARSLSERIEKLTCKARKFVEADPFLGIQTPVYNLDEEWEVRRAGFRPRNIAETSGAGAHRKAARETDYAELEGQPGEPTRNVPLQYGIVREVAEGTESRIWKVPAGKWARRLARGSGDRFYRRMDSHMQRKLQLLGDIVPPAR